MNKLTTILLASLMGVPALAQEAPAAGSVIDFEGRQVEIAPFFEDFPYSQFSMSKEGDKLFFLKTSTENRLQWIALDGVQTLEQGKDAIDANLSTRNCWSPRYNAADGCMYWIGDESNEEIINIYRSKLDSPKSEKLTDVPYIYAWDFNPARDKIAYVSRMGQNEARLDELHILDLKTLEDQLVCTDKPDFRYTWGSISWKPDGKGLLLLALKGMDRQYCNVLYIDVETKQSTVLTDATRMASYAGCDVMDEWNSDDECFFFSDQDGYKNLYRFTASTKQVEQVTRFTTDLAEACYVTIGKEKYLFALQGNPIETTMMLLSPKDGSVLYKQASDMNLSIGSHAGNRVKLLANNVTTLIQIQEVTVGKKKMATEVTFDLPEALKEELVQTEVERLSIPTFDTDPATGQQRMLHAYLYKPKNPLPADKSVVMLESFYGGDNRYDQEYQILGKAGIYVLSASPRGSAGFGRDFAALNDKDLGGNEIIDIIECAKYISRKLDIPAERVGCFGVSHGGYATMRLLTFPGEVNGNKASFPFGFGVETAGFCDIIYQHMHSNIPDWTELEAGNPVTDKEKIIDRSPLYHAARLTGPLLLVHGNHDNRVDIEGSRLMDRMLTQLRLPHRYIEFEGLGHGVKGKEYSYRFYHECFRFIEEVIGHKEIK